MQKITSRGTSQETTSPGHLRSPDGTTCNCADLLHLAAAVRGIKLGLSVPFLPSIERPAIIQHAHSVNRFFPASTHCRNRSTWLSPLRSEPPRLARSSTPSRISSTSSISRDKWPSSNPRGSPWSSRHQWNALAALPLSPSSRPLRGSQISATTKLHLAPHAA